MRYNRASRRSALAPTTRTATRHRALSNDCVTMARRSTGPISTARSRSQLTGRAYGSRPTTSARLFRHGPRLRRVRIGRSPESDRREPTISPMSVPSRIEAAAMLRALRPNEKLQRHSTAVAEVAAFLADAMIRRGVALDGQAVETAALLHDLDKMLPETDPLRVLG